MLANVILKVRFRKLKYPVVISSMAYFIFANNFTDALVKKWELRKPM